MKKLFLSLIILFPLFNLPAQISFENHVQPIFTDNCAFSGCHLGPNAQENLDLSAGNSYGDIVNVPSNDFPDLFRVHPGKPDSSYLVWKIEGRSGIMGAQMPFGMAPLQQGQIDTIRQWITEGALLPITTRKENQIASTYQLHQNFPNPFNPRTTISLEVVRQGNVRLTVFNINGERVSDLIDEELPAGSYHVTWNATNDRGQTLPSGIYVYRLSANGFEQTKRMLLLK
ncbi:MAG: T9SS C-terminal target domain-containing protein [Calditrichaeota bacterium]|nr:T9SS type A sorting domain-containing protein [Calditrichota bacterium]RQW04743.1 MAG: T9SS C-terminal target domain-containing protein [Calditrichota bacterium]